MKRFPHHYDYSGNDDNQHLSDLMKKSSTQAHEDVKDKKEKPCKTCHDFRTWMKMKKSGTQKTVSTTSFEEEKYNPSEDDLDRMKRMALQCPLDKDELGNSTWGFLHTMSVYYPMNPSNEEKQNMSNFIQIFSQVYPCEPCAEDFRKDLKINPPNVESGPQFSEWLCQAHNRVNRKLEKPLFDCSKVFERWRDGWKDGRCD